MMHQASFNKHDSSPRSSWGRTVGFNLSHCEAGLDHGIRVQADRVDSLFNQESREFRVIAGCLAADPDLAAAAMGGMDGHTDHRLDNGVAFVEQFRNQG